MLVLLGFQFRETGRELHSCSSKIRHALFHGIYGPFLLLKLVDELFMLVKATGEDIDLESTDETPMVSRAIWPSLQGKWEIVYNSTGKVFIIFHVCNGLVWPVPGLDMCRMYKQHPPGGQEGM